MARREGAAEAAGEAVDVAARDEARSGGDGGRGCEGAAHGEASAVAAREAAAGAVQAERAIAIRRSRNASGVAAAARFARRGDADGDEEDAGGGHGATSRPSASTHTGPHVAGAWPRRIAMAASASASVMPSRGWMQRPAKRASA